MEFKINYEANDIYLFRKYTFVISKTIFYAALCVVMAGIGVYHIITKELNLGLICVFGSLFILATHFAKILLLKNQLKRSQGSYESFEVKIDFLNEKMCCQAQQIVSENKEKDSITEIPYINIMKAIKYKDLYFLYTRKDTAIIIPARSLIKGNIPEFERFILAHISKCNFK